VSICRRDHGGAIFLRQLVEADINTRYVTWFTDPLFTRFLEAQNISRDDAIAHLENGRQTGGYEIYAICQKTDGQHIGNLKLGPIHRGHSTSDLITVIGDRSAWGKGYARESIKIAIDIAFNELNIRKLSASIDSLNIGSIKAYTAAGFEIESILRDQFSFYDGKTTQLSDKVYVAAFNPNFRPPTEGSDRR
jgi:ribosomal-protein-alanine N-acetyltransferase